MDIIISKNLFVIPFQELSQLGKAGINLPLAAAGLLVQVGTASGTKAFAVFGTEIFCVQIENEYITQQLVQIQLTVTVEKNNIVILVVLQLAGQEGFILHGLFTSEGLGTAVALQRQGGAHTGIQNQRTGHIPHPALHMDGLRDRAGSVPLQPGEIQLLVKRQNRAGFMGNSL